MAGLNYGSLFDRGMDFDDNGRARISTSGEDAGRYKTQVIEDGASSGAGATTIYTVPAGKVLFLSSYSLTTYNANVSNSGVASLRVKIGVTTTPIVNLYVNIRSATIGYINTANGQGNFNMPIKLNAGDLVEVRTNWATHSANATIQGWLENA